MRKEWERERNDRLILQKNVWRRERELKDLRHDLDLITRKEGPGSGSDYSEE